MDEETITTNSSIQSGPVWMDLDYIEKIMLKYTDNNLDEIESFRLETATVKGENYLSALYKLDVKFMRSDIDCDVQERSFIVKTRLENELISELEENFNVFVREAQYYTNIANEIQNLMNIDFGPKTIYIDDRIIVMENLKLRGYSIADVKVGLNKSQCQLVLRQLAKFHAVSMVLYKKNPDMFRFHLPGNISEHPSPIHMMYERCIKSTIEYCNCQEDLQIFVPKLDTFGAKIIAKLINVYSRHINDTFHVLNHGDVWVNNLMFHEREPSVLFIDFQEGFFGSPGIDLNYFIFTSWQPEVFENHFDDLVALYHKTLCETLNDLQYRERIPTLSDVQREIYSKGFHGLATATCLLPILINKHAELSDPENFILDTNEAQQNRRTIFHNPFYGERLNIFLKYFDGLDIL
ncbi:uncharacterized protein LOC142220043 [Haematobia irritans]|uniref:uncharacterized protein LOC142220043 n=1 Tax=Haematobia irritans TaxID=7368 RepID=UPI003F4FF764